MATYQKRGDKWRAIIRRADYPTQSKTFSTRKQAEQWALSIESPMTLGEFELNAELKLIPVSALIRRYVAEVSPTKKSGRNEILRLNRTLRDFSFFGKPVADFDKKDVVMWRDSRLKEVSGASVSREWSSLSAVFTHAIREWGLPIKSNPFQQVKKPKGSKPRHRRVTDDEIAYFSELFDEKITKTRDYAVDMNPKLWTVYKIRWLRPRTDFCIVQESVLLD